VLIGVSTQPIRDEDIWWHVLIGTEVLDTRRVSGLGNDWSRLGDSAWLTTQWLSEVVYSLLHSVGGWQAVTVPRLAVSVVCVLGIALLVMPGRKVSASVPVAIIALLSLALWLSRDRPAGLVLPLVIVLSFWLHRALSGSLPRWWLVMLVTAVWSNLHGSWILVPSIWLLLLLLEPLRPAPRQWKELVVLLLASSASGMANPAGWEGTTAILRFPSRTQHIIEWQPTPPIGWYGIGLLALTCITFVSWGRSAPRPWSEIVVAMAVSGFGLLAIRNVPIAVLMLAPMASDALNRLSPRDRKPGTREARSLPASLVLLTVAGLAVASASWWRTDPLALTPAARLSVYLPTSARVLTTYSAGGAVAALGPRGTEVLIDGRADRFTADYVDEYLNALAGLPGWEDYLRATSPTWAILSDDVPITDHLRELGWVERARDGDFVLLEDGNIRR
jgi:hypothetical protein